MRSAFSVVRSHTNPRGLSRQPSSITDIVPMGGIDGAVSGHRSAAHIFKTPFVPSTKKGESRPEFQRSTRVPFGMDNLLEDYRDGCDSDPLYLAL